MEQGGQQRLSEKGIEFGKRSGDNLGKGRGEQFWKGSAWENRCNPQRRKNTGRSPGEKKKMMKISS